MHSAQLLYNNTFLLLQMITPFPFIIWSLGPGWPCWKRCEGNHFQMCTNDGPLGVRVRGVSCRAEAIDAPCLLPIFEFSAHYGTHPVTSSKPLLRPVLCRLLKPKKQTPDPIHYFCSRAVLWVTRASFKLEVPVQTFVTAKSIRPAEVSLNSWILTSCNGRVTRCNFESLVGTVQVNRVKLLD